MCGITGLICKDKLEHNIIQQMVETIRYRGPDETGYFIEDNIGLGHARLKILDLDNGKQPIFNEDKSIVLIFNGEIFNYKELAVDLKIKGHIIANRSDTAILPHMYEEYGVNMFDKLNGQFAIAIWNRNTKELVLARDRMGEKPLYYYNNTNCFCFASEIKAILKSGYVVPRLSKKSLGHFFTHWAMLNSETMFEGISSLEPGHYIIINNDGTKTAPYYKFTYTGVLNKKIKNDILYIEEAEELLISAVEKRLMSDVPIGCYLSGGLDSSLISAIAARKHSGPLSTFSIIFDQNEYNEARYQEMVSKHLNTNHSYIRYSMSEIPNIIRDVVKHSEQPFTRPSVFPLYKLAKHVRENDITVVLSGEGADELFGGYNNYKTQKIKDFYNQHSDFEISKVLIPILEMNGYDVYSDGKLQKYKEKNSISSSTRLLNRDIRNSLDENEQNLLKYVGNLDLSKWTSLQKSQYLDLHSLLSAYTLSTEGDRITMASSIECRYPFLDAELMEFARKLPDAMKISILNEKYILKEVAKKYLPAEIVNRKKFPFYAPLNIGELLSDYDINYMLSNECIQKFGIFDPVEVSLLRDKWSANREDNNVKNWWEFLGILTTQLLYDEFINKN